MKTQTVLLVGFRKFGSYAANSGEQAIKGLVGRKPAGFDLHHKIYPADVVSDNRGVEVLGLAKKLKATVIALGMASHCKGIRIETRTYNRAHHPVYHPTQDRLETDRLMDEEIVLNMDQWGIDRFIDWTLENEKLLRPEWSLDPGRFCCNQLIWQLARAQQVDSPAYGDISWIFLHIPCTPEAKPSPGTDFTKAGKITMEVGLIIRNLEIFLNSALPVVREVAVA